MTSQLNIILNKTDGKYTTAKSAGRFSGIKMYFAGVDIEDKGAFSHLSGNCKEIDPRQRCSACARYQNDELFEKGIKK